MVSRFRLSKVIGDREATLRLVNDKNKLRHPDQDVSESGTGFFDSAVPNRPRGTSVRWEGARTISKAEIRFLHQQEGRAIWRFMFELAATVGLASSSLLACQAGHLGLMVFFWCVCAFVAHSQPLAFHDASHGTLHPLRWVNEIFGMGIATIIMVPLSVYRHAHAEHHTRILSERDPELWPFTMTSISRSFRRYFAFMEITFGFLMTPCLFLRSYIVADNLSTAAKRRIRLEYALVIAFWGTFAAVVTQFSLWTEAAVAVIVPWVLTGMLQTINKYVEHMGMMGEGILASSRSVVPAGVIGDAFSASWQNVHHHGTHHLYARIPYYKLPQASEHVFAGEPPKGTLFSSYTAAFWDMLKTLHDPRVGPQWLRTPSEN